MTEIKICDRSRSLEVSKKFYEKASRYGSDEYAMLRQARLDFPNYKIVVVARKPSKTSKPVFKGLTYEFMAAYIIKHEIHFHRDSSCGPCGDGSPQGLCFIWQESSLLLFRHVRLRSR